MATPTDPKVVERRNVEQLGKAQAAYTELAMAGMQPTLECNGYPNHNNIAEFDVGIAGNTMMGVLHEDIVLALAIAEKHGGRLWLGEPDWKLSIVWPLPDEAPGPDGQDGPEREIGRAKHGVQKEATA